MVMIMDYIYKILFLSLKISILIFFLSCFAFPQSYRQELLETVKKHKGIKVDSVQDGIYKIQTPDGKIKYQNLNNFNSVPKLDIPSITIDLYQLDTSLYSTQYSFWQQVPVFNAHPMSIGDFNNNGKTELYGRTKNFAENPSPLKIFELGTDNSFHSVYTFNDSILNFIAKDDFDNDGIIELMTLSVRQDRLYPIFKGTSINQLPTSFDFIFNSTVGTSGDSFKAQIDNPIFIHIDKDTAVTFLWWADAFEACIYKYNRYRNNFDSICFFQTVDGTGSGFAIDDFDNDGRIEFSIAGIEGTVQVIKNIGINQYKQVWTGVVPTYNTYIQFSSNDVDKNGKKELWIGGCAYYNNFPKTILTAFEYSDSSNYVPVCEIVIPGIFSLTASNGFATDIDGDGVDEIMICIDQNFVILKFDGSKNYQHYKVFYLCRDTIVNGDFFAGSMYDLFGDGKKEILISGGIYDGSRYYTNIYKKNFTDGIKNEKNNKLTDKIGVYPNPFNGQVKIQINNSKGGKAKVRIFDLLGRLQKTLINDFLDQGMHNLNWDGTNERREILPSGIYFIVLEKQDSFNCQKLLFLK
jgi:hypothetical protein